MREIPLLDFSDGGNLAHARERIEATHAILDVCFEPAPARYLALIGSFDVITATWLRRTASPYAGELDQIVRMVRRRGVASLNVSFFVACTTSGLIQDGVPMMRRVVDWPLPGFGANVATVLQSGRAGPFYNMTWPGFVGVITAMAPGRFCGAYNQAPMRRRTRGRGKLALDVAANIGRAILFERGWPPDHLLRYVFENCASFGEAVETLAREELASPAIFTLTGVGPEEIALIERTEREARLFMGPATAANDWRAPVRGWAARFGYRDNLARKAALASASPGGPAFGWLAPPVLCRRTIMAAELSAAGRGSLIVRGYETPKGEDVAIQVTKDLDLRHMRGSAAPASKATTSA